MHFNKGAAYEHETYKGLDNEGHNVAEVEFFDTTFDGCNFEKAAFQECKFEKCRFVDCNLSLTTFKDTSLLDVEFVGCKMLGINWTEPAKSFFTVGFTGCILNDSLFVGANLRRVKMIDSIANRVDFENADLSDADCQGTDFAGANFANTNLARADLRRARNYAIDPNVNILKKTRFSLPEALALLSYLDIVVD